MRRYVYPIPNTYKGTFAGTVIDGPCRGERRECQSPWFRVNESCMRSVLDPRNFLDPPDALIRVLEYRWSNSLGQWCLYDV